MSEDFYAAGPKRQPGLSFARRNQKILAERLGWPAGALAACWDLENRHPGWHVDWLSENTSPGFERPAGFRAVSRAPVHQHEVTVSAPTAAELEPLMVVPEHSVNGCVFCLDTATVRLRRAGF
jgi:hypothetical protein